MQLREKMVHSFPAVEILLTDRIPNHLDGYYERNFDFPNGIILLNDRLNYYLQNGFLSEELGHHVTSYGFIAQKYSKKNYNVNAARQELRARRYGHKLILPLEKLIECYHHHCWGDIYEMCLYLEIDRSYFYEAIEDYKNQFGSFVRYRGYLINFEPLHITKK